MTHSLPTPITVANCPCCGSHRSSEFIARNSAVVERFRAFSQAKYAGFLDGWEDVLSLEVRRCGACGHLWHAMQPDQASLFAMYAHASKLKGGARHPDAKPHMVRAMRELLGVVRHLGLDGDAMLDFGSGAGHWSVAAAQVGWRVTAFEPSAGRSSASAQFRVVTDVAEIDDRGFVAINLEQVLEHVSEPVALLASLARFMRPGAVLRVSVPDVTRFRAELRRDYPFAGQRVHILSPFEHLHGFTPRSLHAALERAGLVPIPFRKLLPPAGQYVFSKGLARVGAPWQRTLVLARFRN